MIKKPSVLSKIRVSSPLIESLRSDLNKAGISFCESLTNDQMANALPPTANLGTLKNGTPITRDAIANQANSVPIAQTPNGTKIITDPKTGKLIVVSNDPNAVTTQTPEDQAKIDQLITLSQQTGVQQANAPSQQTQTHDQNTAQQRAVQQQTTQRVNESDELKTFYDELKQIVSSGPQYDHSGTYVDHKKEKPVEECDQTPELNEDDESSDTGGGEINEDDESSDSTGGFEPETMSGETLTEEEPEEEQEDVEIKPNANDGLVQVNHAEDNMIDSMDALKALGDQFWTPPAVDLKDTVRQTQQNLGGTTPVEDEPHGLMARRNMSQHVKTGLNAMQGMPGNVIGNDFDDVIGIESPYALKLALTIGK